MNRKQAELGRTNREAVRALLSSYLGISRVEIAEKLGLSTMAVGRHVTAIRKEWGGASLPTRRHRHSLGTNDRHAAERALADFSQRANQPAHLTVQWLWEAYIEDNAGKAVLATMAHTWKALAARFGHHHPDAITIDMCREHIAERRNQERGDGTIWTELGHLRMVLHWGVKRHHIARAPYIELPRKPAPKERHLTRTEARALMDNATTPHVRLAIVLLLGTAARVSALLELTWDRCDFERGVIALADPAERARRKGRAAVPMNQSVKAALLEAKQGALTEHVIEWAGKPVKSIKKGLATSAAKAGLDHISAHVLRHTAAVWLAEAGVPMPEIAQYLGHRDSRTTERVYARFSPDHLRGAADVLDMGIYEAGGSNEPGIATFQRSKK